MNVLDPFEVCEIEVWPLWELEETTTPNKDLVRSLDRTEYTAFQNALKASAFGAVLNEKDMGKVEEVELPKSYRMRIIPDELYEIRKHADVRIARRATTIASAKPRTCDQRARCFKGLAENPSDAGAKAGRNLLQSV